jgi:hypothetical protein
MGEAVTVIDEHVRQRAQLTQRRQQRRTLPEREEPRNVRERQRLHGDVLLDDRLLAQIPQHGCR